MDAVSPDDGDAWSPEQHSTTAERLLDEHGMPQVALLRHVNDPYLEELPDDANLDQTLLDVADRYLARISAIAQIEPAAMLLRERHADGFGWLPLAWGGSAGDYDPAMSFWVRRLGEGSAALDRTAVLLAANRHGPAGKVQCEGMAVGLRVVMHVSLPKEDDPRIQVRISGASFSRLHLARAPAAQGLVESEFLNLVQRQVASAFGLRRTSISGYASQPDPDNHRDDLQLAGTGTRGDGPEERVFAWSAHVSRVAGEAVGTVVPGLLVEQFSNADLNVQLFSSDPGSMEPPEDEVSQRPTRSAKLLNDARRWGDTVPDVLRHPADLFEVRQSLVGDRHGNPQLPQPLPADPKDALRSDDLSAAHAYARASELFERLAAYGLTASTYFKAARLPLLLHHRAWFFSQPDGLTVNAEVRYSGEQHGLANPGPLTSRPQLEVRFGSANLTHRDVRDNQSLVKRSQPLGLAADPRWAWHEFGHVLSFAATGALEFPFAHSAGDGLAAIVADPDSQLVRAANPGPRTDVRGYTFPWVRLSRRHDRQPLEGWCWCGRRNQARHARPRLPPLLFKGYTEEQMLSSSLFTLYRAIGGDTWGADAPASPQRSAASDYVVYLIMRAIALLGPSSVVPARSPDAFVSALIDADIGTTDWHVQGDWRGSTPRQMHRVGGTAHKVIRWAFENQGLYATAAPLEIVEGPGKPPAVDLYIPGLGERSEGGYAPVPLSWVTDPDASAAGWHASLDGMRHEGGIVILTVGNRGEQTANDIAVRAWAAPAADSLTWTQLTLKDTSNRSVSGGTGLESFQFEAKDAGGLALRGPYFVLAEASCLDDRSNLDAAAKLACSGNEPPADSALLIDLVANDNNLGLRLMTFA